MVRWLIHASMPFCPVLTSVTRTRRWQSKSAAEIPGLIVAGAASDASADSHDLLTAGANGARG
jgi:hypothetical protein